jgi:excalibur calcium-binding domain-containing protein
MQKPVAAAPSKAAAITGVFYRNCDAARAAGAAPIRRGEPGYAPHLDRDNDGIACEPYKGK